jgi:Carboxypeptidase regulatory-like domain/TonB dependent receptor
MSNTQKSHKQDSDLKSLFRQSCRQVCRCLVLFALAFVSLQPVFCQTANSSISGIVDDPNQAVVPNAVVTLTAPLTGFHRQVTTNQTGYYKFPDLLPGTYAIKVTKEGFSSYATTEFQLFVSQELSLPIKLTVGSVSQEVTVAGTPPLLESETAAVGQVIGSKEIVGLPLNGRNFLQLASLSPGTTPQPSPSTGSPASFASYVSARPNSSVFISGMRESGTSYLLDGIEMRDDRTGSLTFQPTVDALSEFKVERSFFPADEGFHPAIVNVATKAGTNQFHGAAWEFIRNQNIAASNFFATTKPSLHQNQFGVMVSGPIIKNHLFFMFDYEGLRLNQAPTSSGIFPTTAQLNGDFSGPGLTPIYDPATPGTRTQFPGNIIPANRISPVAKNTIATNFFPSGVTGSPLSINYIQNVPSVQTDNQYIGRLDVPQLRGISRNDSLMFRYANLDSEQITAGLSPLAGLSRPVRATNIVLQLVSPLTTNLINVLRVGYQYAYTPQLNPGANTTNYAAQIGLQNVSTFAPNFFPPRMSFTGYTGVGSSTAFNLNTIQNSYTVSDKLTWVKNRHTIEVGFEERYNRTFINSGTYASGVLTFQGRFTSALNGAAFVTGTGNALADFLLGYPGIGTVAPGNNSAHYHYAQFGVFGEDNWKANPNLVLQLGLRYEPSTYPWPEERNNYILDQQAGILLFPSLGQAPRGLLTSPHREFGPRVGFVYSPSFDRNTTVRGGGGIYFDMSQMNELQFQNNGPPFYNPNTYTQTGTTITGVNSFATGTFPFIPATTPALNYIPPHGTTVFTENPTNKTPTNYQWNLNIQHQFGSNSLFEMGYFGAKAIHLSKRLSYNTCSSASDYLCVPSRMPLPNFSEILMSTTRAWSDYNSLQARFEQRLTKGFTGLLGYTWGKSMDIDSAGAIGNSTERSACIQCDKALSGFNVGQRFVASANYDLPFGRGRSFGADLPKVTDAIVGGWQVGAIAQFQGGVPNWVAASANNTGDNGVLNPRANCLSSNIYATGKDNLLTNGFMWLNPAAFSNPAVNTFGNCRRDSFVGPSYANVDTQLSKVFPIREGIFLNFRAEAFNFFNHPNFNLPNSSEASPALLGKITGAQSPRVFQFALKLAF